jgi:RHS repeat-associated protein
VVIPEAFVWRKNLIYGFGQLICEDSSSGRGYLQGDHLGTPSVLTNAAGTVIGRQKSLPFGERMAGAGEKSFRRFTSHEDGTQLPIHMQARMCLPTYGRFAQVDPAYDHSDDGLNLYSYVSNQPITQTDPDGMRDVESGGGGKPANWAYPQLEARYGEGSDYVPGMVQIWIVKGGGTGFFGPPHQDFVSKEYPAAGSVLTQLQSGLNALSNQPIVPEGDRLGHQFNNLELRAILRILMGDEEIAQMMIDIEKYGGFKLAFESTVLSDETRGQFNPNSTDNRSMRKISIDASKLHKDYQLFGALGVLAHEIRHAWQYAMTRGGQAFSMYIGYGEVKSFTNWTTGIKSNPTFNEYRNFPREIDARSFADRAVLRITGETPFIYGNLPEGILAF